jgi:hypothetical protein
MPRIPIGLVGPSTHTNSAHQNARTINLYPEAGDDGAKAPVALFQAPGLVSLGDIADVATGATEIRALHVMNNRLFIIAGEHIVERVGAAHTLRSSALNTTTGPVICSDNNGQLVLGDGTNFYVMDGATYAVTEITDGVDPLVGYYSAYLDGRTYYLEDGTDRFMWSALDDPLTVGGLDFATAEGDPDPSVAMFIVNREVVFLGTSSTEIWGTSGDVDNPIIRISGGFRELGCAARFAALKFADTVIFIGQDRSGHAQVYLGASAGQAAKPISNHGVERDINQALIANPGASDLLRAYEYTEPGHKFYCLSLPTVDITWCYDLATNQWCERGELDSGTGLWTKQRQDVHAFWNGAHYVGGQGSAVLYQQSRAFMHLDGDPLVRLRETPVSDAQGRMIRFNSFLVDMSVGVGLDGDGEETMADPGTDPELMMQFSDDKGRTWSNEITRSIGAIGETLTMVRFGPCGRSRNRVFRVSVSSPVPIVFTAAYADVEVGA